MALSLSKELAVAARSTTLVISGLILCASFRVSLGSPGISSNANCLVFLQFLLTFAFFGPKLPRPYFRILILSSLALITRVAFSMHEFPEQPTNGRLWHINGQSPFSLLEYLVTEEDGVYVASSLFSAVGEITAHESTGLWPPLIAGYESYRKKHGLFPTPLIPTYLAQEGASRFDLLELDSPAPKGERKQALIFLHGFGGNWGLLCFLVAESVSPFGVDTFCPSTDPFGQWGRKSGKEILSKTIETIRSQGYQDLYFSGLSAGAIGGGMILKDFQKEFLGLLFLYGGHPDAADVDLPTLYIFGSEDERVPSGLMQGIIAMHQRRNPRVVSRKMDADHFALIKQSTEISSFIQDWWKSEFMKTSPVQPSEQK